MRQFAVIVSTALALLGSQALSAESQEIGSRITTFVQFAPQLDREKSIWVYLPPGYGADENKRFPVVYMQDGQYLFDPPSIPSVNPYMSESLNRELEQGIRWYGSWQIDRRLDHLFAQKRTDGMIVVGVSSGEADRTTEYSPWPWSDAPVAEGDRYIEFIVETLKPYVDAHYRTLGGRADTAIAGSSMGGLLALYAGLKCPQVFSKVAAFSPVVTTHVLGRKLLEYISRQGKSYPMKIYVDIGGAELSFGPIKPVHDALRAAGFANDELWFRQIPRGKHRIESWGERFPGALLWLYRSR